VDVAHEAAIGWTMIQFTAPSDRIEGMRDALAVLDAEIDRG
jgi:hypothetical protein